MSYQVRCTNCGATETYARREDFRADRCEACNSSGVGLRRYEIAFKRGKVLFYAFAYGGQRDHERAWVTVAWFLYGRRLLV